MSEETLEDRLDERTRHPRGSSMVVTVVVFSKDRPLQLDAALSSIELNLADGEASDIHVLYRASTPRYAAGYRILAGQHPRAILHAEADFKSDLIGLLSRAAHVIFLVDDTIFVAEFALAAAINALALDPGLVGFSYRLGRNTTYCYTLDKPQRLPAFDPIGAGTLSFDWTSAEHDFGYPLEVSSSMYRTADILPIIERLAFRNPNTLEAGLAHEADGFRTTRPRLACYQQSVALSVPANMVQTAWANRVDGRPELAPEALLERYEVGDRIDVQHYQGHVPNACHEELEFRFAHNPSIPTVSVVIPCYDQARYLPDAVGSVVAQTYTDWEIVVVDDGSPDDTAAVAARLASDFGDRIRILRQANAGLASARNAGVVAARGRYILPLDADDMIEPTMLERAVGTLTAAPGVAVAFAQYQQFGEGLSIERLHEFDAALLSAWDYVPYCALYRREVWEAIGGYSPALVWGYEDWDFWLGAIERGYVMALIPEVLFLYRVRGDSMSSSAITHDAELKAILRVRHPSLFTWRRRLKTAVTVAQLDPGRAARETVRSIPVVRWVFRTGWHLVRSAVGFVRPESAPRPRR